MIKKRDRVLNNKIKSKYWSTSHKYGLELPKNVTHALDIDKRTGTELWKHAIEKEIRNVFPAFDFLDDNATVPPGYGFVDTYSLSLTSKWTLLARLVW